MREAKARRLTQPSSVKSIATPNLNPIEADRVTSGIGVFSVLRPVGTALCQLPYSGRRAVRAGAQRHQAALNVGQNVGLRPLNQNVHQNQVYHRKTLRMKKQI